jgi:riboflavin kinase/FMN adenylyltransferase
MSVVEGIVVVGDRRGRQLGFPTANVETRAELPEDGVYAGRFERADGSVHLAAVSIGRRPTYYAEGVRLLEAYLLDFDGDLYGEHVRVEVGPRVRLQEAFSSSEALIAQIEEDVARIRRLGEIAAVASGELELSAEETA